MKIGKRAIRRRRLLIVFWTAILLSTLLIVGQAFSTTPTYVASNTSETSAEGTYVGADTCGMCHPEEHSAWEHTGHYVAWNSSSHIDDTRECYSCHVNGTNYETLELIGQDIIGFTATNVPVDDGVSCETCHGPKTADSPGPGHMPVVVEAELCGECHSPFHSTHGSAYERWALSEHATSQMKLLEGAIENPYCMHCNTAEGALLDATTLAEVENGITCAVCHDPHSHENPSQLREASVNEECFVCHSHESEEDFLHLHREVYDWRTEEIKNADCATCHMYGADYSGRTSSWDKNVNHTMTVRMEACGQEDLNTNVTSCHNNPAAAWHAMEELVDMGMDKIAATEAYAAEAFAAFETANTTAGADAMKLAEAAEVYAALDDLDGEIGHAGTSAFHAPWYLEELLDEANMEAQELIHLSEAAMEPMGKETVTVTDKVTTTVSEYGVQLLTVLGLAGALLVAVLRRRKV